MLTFAKTIRDFLPDNARCGMSEQAHDEHGFLLLSRVKRVVNRGFNEIVTRSRILLVLQLSEWFGFRGIIPLCAFSYHVYTLGVG